MLLAVLVSGINAAWGQSDKSAVYTSNVTLSTTGGTSASTAQVSISSTSYDAIKAGTSGTAGAVRITAPAGTKYLHLHIAAWNGETVNVSLSPNGNLNASYLTTTADAGIKSSTPFTLSSPTKAPTDYYKVLTFKTALASNTNITITAGANSTSGNRFVIWGVNSEEESVAPAYTITAQSNNNTYGTVSLDGSVITGSPALGYRYASPAYTVITGSASVVQVGNNFTVTPSTDCTVQINFEAIPTHTANFSVNGNTSRTATVAEGAAITFPTAAETPADATEFNKTIEGKTFVGWYTSTYSDASEAPSYVNTATTTMSESDVTYYAVYADVEEEESDDIKDAVKSQTLKYDDWTYSGTTADKDTYRLFGDGAYVESDALDLSKLMKVVVYGGTFGGSTYNSISIGDGTSTWKDVTVTGSSQTGENIYTGGTALSGTKALRVTSNSGNGSTTGVRISKVEIYVKGTNRTESNYSTTVPVDANISFAEAEVSMQLTSGYTGQDLINPNGVTVAYSSSDETVATVNASTGEVSMLKAGTTIITATFAGDATYKPAEVSYELTVTEKTPSGLAYDVAEVEKLTTDAAFTNALTNSHSLSVSYSSSATGVAIVDSSTGEVTIKGAGETTITASFAGDEDYEAGNASYTLTVSKAAPTLSFASENATGREGEAFAGNELNNPANLSVSYSSSDTDVATVNETSGAVTIVAGGTTTITASFTGNDTYTAGSASYTLKVLATPTIPAMSDEEIAWGETFTVDDSGITGGTVSVSSDNTSIATVDGLEITPVACGEVVITVSTAEDETYKAGSTTFTLTVTAPEGSTEVPSDILLFGESFGNNTGSARDWNDSYSVKTGVKSVYSGVTGYTVSNARQTKNTVGSDDSGLTQSTAGTDAYIIIGPLNVAGYSNMTLSYQWKAASIKGTYSTSAYYATSSSGEYTEMSGTGDGATTFVERSYSVPAAAQVSTLYLKIVWNTSNTQAIIDEVQLTAPAQTSTTASLNASGYGTFCSVNPMDFSAPEGYTAWRISSIEMENETTGIVTCNKITEAIKGGQGVLLYNKNAGGEKTNVTVTFADGTTEFSHSDNLLIGTTAPLYVVSDEYFGLSGSNFVPVNPGVVPAGKALLDADDIPDFGSVKSFIFVFNDDATGITETRTATREEVEAIFNLGGQRMSKMQRGINIVNGKKVLVK